jgi:7,8-dihydropterin-6-yl-methyl-4-(beta-D-ribofuranosyl)aminobenzene 5'-phosphate synthase
MQISLQPVDGVRITTLIDNSSDALLPDEGLVRRWGLFGSAGPLPIVPNGMSLDGKSVDFLRAEHGFSALIEIQDGTGLRRVLFDAGVTPDGLIGNLDRLAIPPDTFEAIVFSHGHFDHAKRLTGVDHLHALLGGFHLRGGPIVGQTVDALAAESPDVLVPAHCTSFTAMHALAGGLPTAFRPNAVGSQFTLGALA